MKQTIGLDIYFEVVEEYSKGDYYTPEYYCWGYDNLVILLNDNDVTKLFEDHKNVQTAIYRYADKYYHKDKVETSVVIDIDVEINNDRLFYKNVDITDYLIDCFIE